MSKSISNRIGNALILTFMASIGWGIIGYLNSGIIFGIKFFCAMYIPLFIAMIILVFSESNLDLFNKTFEGSK